MLRRELWSRGTVFKKDILDKLQITDIQNIKMDSSTSKEEIDNYVDGIKKRYSNRTGKIAWAIKEEVNDADGIIISVIIFSEYIFMELYMLKDYQVFKHSLERFVN